MKYYVTADPHGYFSIMRAQLNKAGFFSDPEPHKLIICGDCMDRGKEAVKMQNFILREMEKDEIVLVKGNHEDLFCELVGPDHGLAYHHHVHNGTFDTAVQLTKWAPEMACSHPLAFASEARKTPYYQQIIPAMEDYFETEHYVFVHGWIPSIANRDGTFSHYETWREASNGEWKAARWYNGMDAWYTAPDSEKTVVCGHWDVCYGHNRFEHHGGLKSGKPDFTPFIAPGIIALDACTALSRKVNVVIIEDAELREPGANQK